MELADRQSARAKDAFRTGNTRRMALHIEAAEAFAWAANNTGGGTQDDQ